MEQISEDYRQWYMDKVGPIPNKDDYVFALIWDCWKSSEDKSKQCVREAIDKMRNDGLVDFDEITLKGLEEVLGL